MSIVPVIIILDRKLTCSKYLIALYSVGLGISVVIVGVAFFKFYTYFLKKYLMHKRLLVGLLSKA